MLKISTSSEPIRQQETRPWASGTGTHGLDKHCFIVDPGPHLQGGQHTEQDGKTCQRDHAGGLEPKQSDLGGWRPAKNTGGDYAQSSQRNESITVMQPLPGDKSSNSNPRRSERYEPPKHQETQQWHGAQRPNLAGQAAQ